MFEKTKALCDSFLELGIPGFDLMVYKDGQCVLRHMNGFSDRKNRIPVQGNERYNIFSCSKPITCVAAMQLWEQGKFDLEDELSVYLPEYAQMSVREADGTIRPATKPIRIRNLFEMTAGFNYDYKAQAFRQLHKDTAGKCPTREFARTLATLPLDFEPGDKYQYSLAHDVIAALVEVIAGQPFEMYVKEHIFDPLGMVNSDFLLPIEDYKTVVPLYQYARGTDEVLPMSHGNVPAARVGFEHASGGAGCVSTVEDYMKFLEALRIGDKILRKETIQLMATNRLTPQQKTSYYLGALGYGYGLGMRTADPEKGIFDFGWGGAAGAYLAVDPTHNITLYYAQHVLSSPIQSRRRLIVSAVLEDLFGQESGLQDSRDPKLNSLTY